MFVLTISNTKELPPAQYRNYVNRNCNPFTLIIFHVWGNIINVFETTTMQYQYNPLINQTQYIHDFVCIHS